MHAISLRIGDLLIFYKERIENAFFDIAHAIARVSSVSVTLIIIVFLYLHCFYNVFYRLCCNHVGLPHVQLNTYLVI